MPGAPVDGGNHSPTPLPPARRDVLADVLADVLTEARDAGFLGPGPIARQLHHAEGFVTLGRRLATQDSTPEPLIVDLGSGGGLPALVLASAWPEVRIVLLEANGRRATFLRGALIRLELDGRASVLEERAEVAGRQVGRRGTFDGALARSFGPPAVVAECAAPLLRTGGWLVVSEPPPADAGRAVHTHGERWPADQLGQLGLEPVEAVREGFEYEVLRQRVLCPERFPRRNGVPAKRPLF